MPVSEAELEVEVDVDPEDEEPAPVPELVVELAAEEVPVVVVLLRVAIGGVACPVVGTVSAGAPLVLSALVLLDPHPARTTPTETTANAANGLARTLRVT